MFFIVTYPSRQLKSSKPSKATSEHLNARSVKQRIILRFLFPKFVVLSGIVCNILKVSSPRVVGYDDFLHIAGESGNFRTES